MRWSARSCHDRVIAAAAALALAATGAIAAVAPPATAASSVSVSVDAALQLATVPATGVGVNIPVYDANMNAAATPGLLSTAGINTVRYPGGSHSDVYHWQTGAAEGGAYVAPNTGFDAFMGTVRAAGAQPIITANYGSGTPQEAAAWVQYANVTKDYGVKYWEIGNEVYGNGEYNATWEYDTHSSKSATTYADNVLQYISAMKAADPSVKIGAVLTTPGYWPDGIVGPGDTMDWNHTVLSIAGSKIDFAIVHAYPTSTSPADLLTKPQAQNANITGAVRSLINQYAGSNAPNVGIAVTEANAQAYLDTSPNGLFAPDDYLTWLENGAFNVDWWDLRNGTDCTKVTTVEGATDYNDGGMVSSGSPCEPAVNTPFPAYYGIQMISRLGAPGDTLVKAASSSSLLTAHAVRRANGDVDVMLINKDPNNDATVNLSYTGFTPSSATPTVHSYLKNAHGIGTTQSGSPTTQTVPAYGITVVQMHPTSAPCRVVYNKNEWSGVMVGNVTVVNNSLGQVNGWSLGFNFPGDNVITNSWNASVSQSGPSVNAANVSYNPTVPQGGSVQWGFRATWSSSDANPSAFWFNGASCAIG
ncbi:cellulose binding domain-containing protein [Kitasatospora cathayae]|uniref:Cellulose binding domain-containing protein n=1 Tax=Kitasatospora cathayae TaxID=3004092 RepID=A0ABY7PWK1_9ACTN|nr:cellulose binding domain-containing protein [Kitasatospora sp. HUAS 3-15]WBP84751.1 cellulose binding domain-containing protein [Kitasatospora sp. HUAS 3-15]